MQNESWRNYREWVATALNVFLAPDGLVATDETIDTFAQILECRAKELANPPSAPSAEAASDEELRAMLARIDATDKGGDPPRVREHGTPPNVHTYEQGAAPGIGNIDAAFRAGYHCRWHRDVGRYCFDPAMSPGDPEGAYAAWRASLPVEPASPAKPGSGRGE